jgi:dTDP-4-dehydrorhamnose 3,5-epimerase
VDIRRSSQYFGQWVGQVLSEENKLAMWVPPGFAHGFLTLSDVADFHYKCSDIYYPKSERTIRWDDPAIGIDWPSVEEDGGSIVLSEKDAEFGRLLVDAETFE